MDTSTSAHSQSEPIVKNEIEIFPAHPPRANTPEYRATHQLMVDTLDTPCRICGVKKSTLVINNSAGAKQLESHHYPIQREYFDACDWKKVQADFPQYVVDQTSFEKFVDSPHNMWIICDTHHRDPLKGIHHAIANDWVIERYLLDGYVLNDVDKNSTADIAEDNQIVDTNISTDERT